MCIRDSFICALSTSITWERTASRPETGLLIPSVYDSYAGKQVTVSYRGVDPPNRIAIAFVFFAAMSVSASSQVVLHLNSLHFNAYEPIKVTAINRGSRAISV